MKYQAKKTAQQRAVFLVSAEIEDCRTVILFYLLSLPA
jgi:hypothetical protein